MSKKTAKPPVTMWKIGRKPFNGTMTVFRDRDNKWRWVYRDYARVGFFKNKGEKVFRKINEKGGYKSKAAAINGWRTYLGTCGRHGDE